MIKNLTYIAAILLVLTGGLTGCKKETNVVATTGSISGKYTPAGAAASIIAFRNPGTAPTEVKPGSSDAFSIAGLEPGNYVVSFAAMPGFTAPNPVAVTVLAGENADIGTVVFTPVPPSTGASISGKISPATAGIGIYAKNAAGIVRYWATSDISGNFKINSVEPGTYELSFEPSLQFAKPANVNATVTAGTNTDVGIIALNPAGKQAIDTIANLLAFYTAADAKAFIERAANDSAIVLLASFHAYGDALTPDLMAAVNKIVVAKSIFEIHGASGTLTLSGLKEIAELRVMSSTNLTTLNLPALSRASMVLRECPSLTNINLNTTCVIVSLTVNNTGLTNLTAFQSAGFKSLTLEIMNNTKLTSLAGLSFVADSLPYCTITGNALLTNLNGLEAVKRFTGKTMISNNPVLQSLTGLENAIYARQLTLSDNPQLNTICPAKVLLNYLKTAPSFTEWTNPPNGMPTLVTRQPFVASSNGIYATLADILSAAGQCP